MADEHDEKFKVQLASVELEPRQFRPRGPEYLWDLIGYVNFAEVELETSFGPLRFSINRAVLRLEFDGCEIAQRNAGYRRPAPETRTLDIKEKSETEGNTKGRTRARLGFGFSKGIDASAEAEGELSKDKKTKRITERNFAEIRQLVTFSKREEVTNAMEWIVASVDPGKGLFGAVIDGEDTQGGRLGTLKSLKKGGWSVKPSIRFEPYAEIVNKQNLTVASKTRITAEQAKNEARLGRKLGIISALIGKEMEHVDLSPLVMPGEKEDE